MITIDSAAVALNEFQKTFSPEITGPLRQKMVTESVLTPVTTKHAYVAPRLSWTGDLVQAFQCPWTPHTNTATLSEQMWKLQPLKIDLEWSCTDIEGFFDSWYADWYEWGSGKEINEFDFPRWLYQNHIVPQIENDMERLAYHGNATAVTSGTAHATLSSVDGLKTVIADAITSLAIPASNVIATAAITVSNAVAEIEKFVEALPELARARGGVIYCSEQVQRFFVRDMYENYGQGCCETSVIGNPLLAERIKGTPVFNSNIRVVGLPSMAGSGRLIYSALANNLIVGRRDGESPLPMLRFQVEKRSLIGLAEFHRFYGFRDGRYLFVNDEV